MAAKSTSIRLFAIHIGGLADKTSRAATKFLWE